MFASFKSFWRWWLYELGSLTGADDPRVLAARRATAELYVGPEGVAAVRPPRLTSAFPARTVFSPALGEAVARLKRSSRVVLTVDEAQCFLRAKELPSASLPHAGQILDLELQRSTPFRREDVLTGWFAAGKPARDGRRTVTQAVLRKELLRPALEAIAARPARIVAIAVRHAGGAALPVVFEPDGSPFGAARRARLAKAAAFSAALFAGLICAAAWFSFDRQRQDIAVLEAAITGVEKKALAVRQRLDAAAASRRQARALTELRTRGVPMLAVWEEMSRILPDDAWLQNLTIDGGRIQADGFAAKAEDLIGALETSPLFEGVSFASPVYRGTGELKSRFSLQLKLEAAPP